MHLVVGGLFVFDTISVLFCVSLTRPAKAIYSPFLKIAFYSSVQKNSRG